jgi:mono/diheme cytochrome c family protein
MRALLVIARRFHHWLFPTITLIVFSVPVARAAIDNSSVRTGHQVFMQSGCFACHGEMGYGGAGPTFRGDKLLAAGDYVVGQILIGRGIMPSYAHKLDDREIAAVATYVRNSWGNKFGSVMPDQVAKARASFQGGKSDQTVSATNPPNPQEPR